MGRFTSDSGNGNFTPAPAGTHIARCVKIVDIGTQHGEYKGQPTRRNQVIISWELPDQTIEIEGVPKPILASRFYTNSLGEKANLRHDLESWRGRAFTQEELQRFDLESILDKPCLLTIVSGENGKTKVSGVSGLPKSVQCPERVNDVFTFWLDDFDEGKFDGLSDGLKKLVEKSEEYDVIQNGERYTPPSRNGDYDDTDTAPF